MEKDDPSTITSSYHCRTRKSKLSGAEVAASPRRKYNSYVGSSSDIETYFAPAGRADNQVIERQHKAAAAVACLQQVLDAFPHIAILVNEQRQLIAANQACLTALDSADLKDLLGLRPGEALGCLYAGEHSGGCGTSLHCRVCGAASAVLLSQRRGEKVTQECRITVTRNGREEALDFHVSASPIAVAPDLVFTMVTLADISQQKRRLALEHLFFHDVLNTGNALQGTLARLKRTEQSAEGAEWITKASALTEHFVAEIQAHRDLLLAETNELRVNRQALTSGAVLSRAIASQSGVLRPKEAPAIVLAEASEDQSFVSDETLLGRVLINLIKNASEASLPGQQVTAGCRRAAENLVFWVHNSAAMPIEVQLQVFRRSFSTKGSGRGLGTYSVKLITERYLGGKVDFSSSPEEGTTFRIAFPLGG